ncbi:DUF6261 family protein [Aquimarina mytili]|uniref:Uncharacterized protein n=1 Tax=Aquimarina mytili TaxID=874423 RepID=A0A936ZZA7_9FLAO|nr:DUF6261 family protein [Aquimarina mytili]MBL0682190.1 hypothetical protein [Aquimarina mytili]
MLSPTNVIRLSKEEVIEYLRSTKDICLQNHPKALQIKTQVADLTKAVEQLDDALIYDRKSDFTKVLEELDEQRDNAITGMRYGFLMNTYHNDITKKIAGQALLDHMDTYGNRIARLNYEAESTVLLNIIEDYETQPKLVEALTTVEMADWATILKNTNKAFRTKYQERITIESAAEKLSFTAIKPQALVVYEKLYKRIEALTELDENNTYTTLNNELKTLAKRYQQIINTRFANNQEGEQENNTMLN